MLINRATYFFFKNHRNIYLVIYEKHRNIYYKYVCLAVSFSVFFKSISKTRSILSKSRVSNYFTVILKAMSWWQSDYHLQLTIVIAQRQSIDEVANQLPHIFD